MPFAPGPKLDHVEVDAARTEDPPPVVLMARGRDRFVLLTRLTYVDERDGGRIPSEKPRDTQDDTKTILFPDGPKEWTTDLASVPQPMWGLLGPYGEQLRPALLHDHFCDRAKDLKQDNNPQGALRLRREADNLFRTTLCEEGVSSLRGTLFLAGVSFGRYCSYRKSAAVLIGAIVVVAAVLAYAAIWAGIADSQASALVARPVTALADVLPQAVTSWTWDGVEPYVQWVPGVLAWIALVVGLSALAFTDFGWVVVVGLLSPLLVPYVALTYITLAALYVIDWLVTAVLRLAGRKPNAPVFNPTRNGGWS